MHNASPEFSITLAFVFSGSVSIDVKQGESLSGV